MSYRKRSTLGLEQDALPAPLPPRRVWHSVPCVFLENSRSNQECPNASAVQTSPVSGHAVLFVVAGSVGSEVWRCLCVCEGGAFDSGQYSEANATFCYDCQYGAACDGGIYTGVREGDHPPTLNCLIHTPVNSYPSISYPRNEVANFPSLCLCSLVDSGLADRILVQLQII